MDGIKKLLKPLASLYLTVPLLALSLLLIFFGTLAQRIIGIDEVVAHYFRSWLAWIDPHIFMRGIRAGQPPAAIQIPYLGGKTLILLLLVNLLAAHSVRFKVNWKRSGILLIHFSLIVLLASELLTGYFATESQISLSDGESASYVNDVKHSELAVIDSSPADHDNVTVIPEQMLHTGAVIDSSQIPFQIRVNDYYPNHDILGPVQADSMKVERRATAGEDRDLAMVGRARSPGTDAEKVDAPGAYVTLQKGDKNLGTYLLSTRLGGPQTVQVDGKTYGIALRPQRVYKPYTLHLTHFTHDRYLGTDEAKNFASQIKLIDPSRQVDRDVKIWMNHPLRYRGDTIYQAGFDQEHDRFTTLQVMHSPTWQFPLFPISLSYLPYIALAIGTLGLLIHFGIQLVTFLRRTISGTSKAVVSRPSNSAASRAHGTRTGSWTLPPTTLPFWQRASFWTGSAALAFGLLIVGVMAARPLMEKPKDYDLKAFGQLPIVSEGRVLPMDSLARNTLRIVSGKEKFKRDDTSVPAIEWLTNGLIASEQWRDDRVIRIDHPEIIDMLHLDPKRQYFSIADMMPQIPELQRQANLASQTPSDQRDSVKRKVLQLATSWRLMNQIFGGFLQGESYVVPPTAPGEDWRTFDQVVEQSRKARANGQEYKTPQAAILIARMMDDYRKKEPGSFNADVTEYQKYLDQHAPGVIEKTRVEAYMNAFDPFTICIVFYAIALVLGFLSWLGWRKPLWSAAMSLLIFTLVLHSLGLATRIWLQGRPPVTNLYSSAVFIGWGVAVLCVLLELVYRNGIAVVASAALGFVTLVIALHLSSDATLQPNGDTMAVLSAVLDTNLWLATHVVCITLGYASTFLAGALGVVYVTRGLFTTSLDTDLRKNLSRMIYGIVCFAMFFSFVGTILGGIWADQSWGRFWGWDPKENGAILIVLWNALILHARWSGMVRERGLAQLAILGNIVTSWSWFGTNMLGIGLHSYGFMDQAVPWLVGFDLSQLALVFTAMIPLNWWRSFEVASPASNRAVGFAVVSK